MTKDIYGYITDGGYLGYSRTSRRIRGNNQFKRLKKLKNNNNIPDKPKKNHDKRNLIMLMIGLSLIIFCIVINLNK